MNHYESDHQPVYLCSSSISTCSFLSSYLKDHVHDACKSDMIYYIFAKADFCITFLEKKIYYHLDCLPQSSAGQERPSALVLLQDLDSLFSVGP